MEGNLVLWLAPECEDQASYERVGPPHSVLAILLPALVFPFEAGPRLAASKLLARGRN